MYNMLFSPKDPGVKTEGTKVDVRLCETRLDRLEVPTGCVGLQGRTNSQNCKWEEYR
jgi:hypothetical protein